jgi:hypothetical protein
MMGIVRARGDTPHHGCWAKCCWKETGSQILVTDLFPQASMPSTTVKPSSNPVLLAIACWSSRTIQPSSAKKTLNLGSFRLTGLHPLRTSALATSINLFSRRDANFVRR